MTIISIGQGRRRGDQAADGEPHLSLRIDRIIHEIDDALEEDGHGIPAPPAGGGRCA